MTIAKRVPALVAAAVLLSGCTSGDDEIVAAGDTAEAEVIAAIDAAQSGTGHLDVAIEFDEAAMLESFERTMDDMPEASGLGVATPFDDPEDWLEEMRDLGFTAEYSGGDHRIRSGDDLRLRVGDRTFISAESALQLPVGFGDGPDSSAVELPVGVEWVEQSNDDDFLLSAGLGLSVDDGELHVLRSDQLTDITGAGASDVDGTPSRRFTASLTPEALADQLGISPPRDRAADSADGDEFTDGDDDADAGDGDFDDAWTMRSDAIDAYVREHTTSQVEIHLAEDGSLLRISATVSTEVEPQYAECSMLFTMPALTAIADYSALGSDVEIAEPPADSVMSSADFHELLGTSYDDWADDDWMNVDGGLGFFGSAPGRIAPGDLSYGPDGEPLKVQTAAGERYRADVEDDLVKFGSVIGIDPAAVADLDDAALVDAHDRAAAALAAMPKTATVMGEMTRVELLWNVKWGMETVGVDPTTADGLGDAELAGLIDTFVGENGVSGDGIWGDGAMSYAEMYGEGGDWLDEEWPTDDPSDDELFGEMFEGCPT